MESEKNTRKHRWLFMSPLILLQDTRLHISGKQQFVVKHKITLNVISPRLLNSMILVILKHYLINKNLELIATINVGLKSL